MDRFWTELSPNFSEEKRPYGREGFDSDAAPGMNGHAADMRCRDAGRSGNSRLYAVLAQIADKGIDRMRFA